MLREATTVSVLDPLRVFVEFDKDYEVWVARCLQTGHLVTANDAKKVKEMITELLQDEVSDAIKRGDLAPLLSHPAPIEAWIMWDMACRANNLEQSKIRVHSEIPQELRVLVGQAEVETEIKIATGRSAAAA